MKQMRRSHEPLEEGVKVINKLHGRRGVIDHYVAFVDSDDLVGVRWCDGLPPSSSAVHLSQLEVMGVLDQIAESL